MRGLSVSRLGIFGAVLAVAGGSFWFGKMSEKAQCEEQLELRDALAEEHRRVERSNAPPFNEP